MKRTLIEILVDPDKRHQLRLQQEEEDGDEITSGVLRAIGGTCYAIRSGIPRFVVTSEDQNQAQTSSVFAFKWKKRDTYDSNAAKKIATIWMIQKYGFASQKEWVRYYSSKRRILDLGCGSGFSSSLWLDSELWTGDTMWVGVDISSAIDVARDRLSHISNTHFVQADALSLPFRCLSFDAIFSEGVLHHTPSTRRALLSAIDMLEHGGEIHFYVYRRKSPVREFTDDYVRKQIAPLTNQDAWNEMRSLTRLGQSLAQLKESIEVEEDIPSLGIRAGKHDLHRLIYWNFAKLFWNASLSFEENVHVNFDWYRPSYAHRHTSSELYKWCSEAGLSIKRFHEQKSGFSVCAVKK